MKKKRYPELPDVSVFGQGGSVLLVTPNTKAAKTWLRAHVEADAVWLGNSLAVEARYVGDLLAGLREDGFRV